MTDNISTLLSQVATVAYVRCSTLGMKRLDKEASRKAERDHNAKEGISNVSVSRLAGAEPEIKAIVADQSAGRALLVDCTTAWGDRRLLSNNLLERFMKPFSEIKKSHDSKVEAFVRIAPERIAAAERNKGSFNVKLPSVGEIEKAFSMEFRLEPVPDVSAYKSGNLDKAVERVLKERFEANIKAAYIEAQADAIKRMAEPLANLVDRMVKYEEREKAKAQGLAVDKAGTFNDSIIRNIQDFADMFTEWNFTNDPIMKRFDDALSAFANIDAKDLRNSDALRKDVSDRASKILEEIRAGGYL
jgi:hypothetical protein